MVGEETTGSFFILMQSYEVGAGMAAAREGSTGSFFIKPLFRGFVKSQERGCKD